MADETSQSAKAEAVKTESKATESASASTETLDVTKLAGDQLSKVLENPELWKQPRMKELLEASRQLKEISKAKQEDEEKSLSEQKKFEELANKKAEENKSLQEQLQNMKIDQTLISKLATLGTVDLDGALKLINRSGLKVDSNGAVEGVDEAIESLKTDRAYLFTQGSATKTLGSATNQNQAVSGTMKFTRSQLKDPTFYAANREEILKASAAGQIVDDISQK